MAFLKIHGPTALGSVEMRASKPKASVRTPRTTSKTLELNRGPFRPSTLSKLACSRFRSLVRSARFNSVTTCLGCKRAPVSNPGSPTCRFNPMETISRTCGKSPVGQNVATSGLCPSSLFRSSVCSSSPHAGRYQVPWGKVNSRYSRRMFGPFAAPRSSSSSSRILTFRPIEARAFAINAWASSWECS